MSGRMNLRAAEYEPVLRAMVTPLRERLKASGMSHARLGILIRYERSRVSRALSGREVPPRHRIEQIAQVLGADVDLAMRRWKAADALRRKGRVSKAGGGPPNGIASYTDFLSALRDLLSQHGISQRKLAHDSNGRLRRSTVGAVLRGERSARPEMVAAIVQACGEGEAAMAAWDALWWRYGRPHQEEQHRRRREGYDMRTYAGWLDAL
ncbi:helix-turn-helix transcriptional regulator [Sphaerisporangium sp. NBC_01403]|uniref:helix-turn-helix domain-containing protein n=1 Tax=Sphaerisporangium sp. NBC_01403 TaxID=2903599 RepID=UPI00324747FF